MDEVGNVIWRKHYKPYGEEIEQGAEQDAAKDNRIGYTGHVHDQDTGLSYIGAVTMIRCWAVYGNGSGWVYRNQSDEL